MRRFTVINDDEKTIHKIDDEKNIPVFWKIFGGSVFSIILFLILAIFGYVVNGVQNLQENVNKVSRESITRIEVSETLQQQRDKIGSAEATILDLKEKIKVIEKLNQDLSTYQEKIVSLEKLTINFQEEIKLLREQITQLRERLAKLETPLKESVKN